MKYTVPIEIDRSKVEILLAALKVAESWHTSQNNWDAASQIGKLNTSLRKQIFEMTEVN